MNKKLTLSIITFIVLLAIGLPYGAFSWNTAAQSYTSITETEESVNLPPPSDVVNYGGKSYSFFIEDGKLAVYGECLAVNGLCSLVALVDFSTIESGATIYDGDLVIKVYQIADGIWQINFYEDGVLIDDKSQVYVDANGVALLVVRN